MLDSFRVPSNTPNHCKSADAEENGAALSKESWDLQNHNVYKLFDNAMIDFAFSVRPISHFAQLWKYSGSGPCRPFNTIDQLDWLYFSVDRSIVTSAGSTTAAEMRLIAQEEKFSTYAILPLWLLGHRNLKSTVPNSSNSLIKEEWSVWLGRGSRNDLSDQPNTQYDGVGSSISTIPRGWNICAKSILRCCYCDICQQCWIQAQNLEGEHSTSFILDGSDTLKWNKAVTFFINVSA